MQEWIDSSVNPPKAKEILVIRYVLNNGVLKEAEAWFDGYVYNLVGSLRFVRAYQVKCYKYKCNYYS